MSGPSHGPSRPHPILEGVQSRLQSLQSKAKAATHSGLKSLRIYVNGVYLYYPNCKGKLPPNINLDVVSHVFYAFAAVKPDGGIILDPERDEKNNIVPGSHGCLHTICQVRDAKNKNLKILLSCGGGGVSKEFTALASTQQGRQTFANAAKQLLDAHKLNGLDIDWEYPLTNADGANFVLLLSALRAVLPAPRYLLTAAFASGPWALQYTNLAAASTYLDLMNIMAYDFAGPWTRNAGHQAQLYDPAFPNDPSSGLSGQSAVTYFRSRGVPANKIALGCPIYGRSFLGATKPGDTYSKPGGDDGAFDYNQLPRPFAEELVDTKAGAAYCVGGDGGFVSYDNPQTVAMKAKFAKDNGLAGLFYWSGSTDAIGARSLMMAGFAALHG